ncbi:MAG: PhoH family protein [Phycisphaeraceae bacterium]|nr:PhoH family protein [Phycisphaeraceae bacterium]
MSSRTDSSTLTSPPTPDPKPEKRRLAKSSPKGPDKARAVKSFVLDTNVLLHDDNAMFVFQEHNVVIPFPVIEELDGFKRAEGEVGRNARHTIRRLDELSVRGRLIEGVQWGEDTGRIIVDIEEHDRPLPLHGDSPDNRIISSANALHRAGVETIFISKDINARVKCRALEIPAEDYETERIDPHLLFTGFRELSAPGELINTLHEQRMLPLNKLVEAVGPIAVPERESAIPNGAGKDHRLLHLEPNEFVIIHDALDPSHSGLARRLADTDHLIPISGPRKPVFGILPRNVQQTMALDLLLDDEVSLVTLTGGAGTGKTLLALAAAMLKSLMEERYERVLVARPIMPMGRDIGYLPGDKDEKLGAWMQPIFDNLEFLIQTRSSPTGQHAESKSVEQRLERLLADGKVIVEALTYIRGRSIPNQFLIVDEAQNLTPHEVKTIITRVGEGTKLVLTGDIAQIDNPYLDMSSNGLSYAVERMKDLGITGHVTLVKSERSELASLAVERL